MVQRICLVLLLVTSLLSCKKDKKSAQELIQGTWHLVTINSNEVVNGEPNNSTHTGQATDYFRFDADGALETKVSTSLSHLEYSITNNSTLLIGGILSYEILQLDEHHLLLYNKDLEDGQNYTEITITFQR